jgi:hypothetical protein
VLEEELQVAGVDGPWQAAGLFDADLHLPEGVHGDGALPLQEVEEALDVGAEAALSRGPSPPPSLGLHVHPKHRIDSGLVSLPLSLEPVQEIRVEPDRDHRLGSRHSQLSFFEEARVEGGASEVSMSSSVIASIRFQSVLEICLS